MKIGIVIFHPLYENNKGFAQSAETKMKGDIYATANAHFRKEIRDSNPEYAKHLADYSRTVGLSEILGATIERRTGQTRGGAIRSAMENATRVIGGVAGSSVGGIPGAVVGTLATEGLMRGVGKLTGSSAKLALGKRLIEKSKKSANTQSTPPKKKLLEKGTSPQKSSSPNNGLAKFLRGEKEVMPKPSKKLLDRKTPLKPQNNKKTSAGGKDPSPTDVYNSSIADFYKKSNKKELSREFDLNRESSYRNTIADFYKKANKSTKISEDGTPYYIRVDGTKVEYKKPENIRQKDFRRKGFRTDDQFLLNKKEIAYQKTLDDVQLGKKEIGIIGKDSEVGDIHITTQKYADKYMAHGPINNANVVATINRWEYKIKNRAGDPDVVNYIKPFPKNSSYGMLVGVRKDKDGNFVTTTYEPHTKIADLLKKEEGKGGIIEEKGKEAIGV